jgi:hypothetical protein
MPAKGEAVPVTLNSFRVQPVQVRSIVESLR